MTHHPDEQPELPRTMSAVLLVGHGGLDKLEYHDDVPLPVIGPDEVLIRVAAAGINNTDINTRAGWYSKGVNGATNDGGTDGFASSRDDDATWTGTPMSFPRIQGADCCGRIVAVGSAIDPARIGERVVVQNTLRYYANFEPMEAWGFGSECDGAFAQYTKAPSIETHAVDSDWTDVELASIPIAYSTAENMLHRAGVVSGEHVVITGASGGVGSAAVQLAKRRGAIVTAVVGPGKADQVREFGADGVVVRGESLVDRLGSHSVDVVIDVTAGATFTELLEVLRKGGRYAVAGAIAGPIVELDVRTLYLKDLTIFGCTFQDDIVFRNLISYVEKNEIRPLVSRTFPLKDIVEGQEYFLSKVSTGKVVLVVP